MLLATLAILIFTLTNCKNDKPQISEAAQKKIEAGLDTLTGAPARSGNPYTEDGCSLLPDADFQAIFGINPATEANKRTLKNESFCLWVWKRADWKQRESHNDKSNDYQDPEARLALKLVNFGTETDASAQLKGLENKETQVVPGLGAAAIWLPERSTLVVQQKSFNIHFTVEMSDAAAENLEKAKSVAAKVLGNMAH